MNFFISDIKKIFLVIYANINKKYNNYQELIHTNYFKEIELIFILIYIFKFDIISKYNLNKNTNNLNTLNIFTKNLYINKDFWQINNTNYQPLDSKILIKNEIKNQGKKIIKNFEFYNIKNFKFFYQLSNIYSFLISNITIMLILFVLKPSILLSSMRLLSLSLFTY